MHLTLFPCLYCLPRQEHEACLCPKAELLLPSFPIKISSFLKAKLRSYHHQSDLSLSLLLTNHVASIAYSTKIANIDLKTMPRSQELVTRDYNLSCLGG
jgi:hypothetical protein